jgi:hypothetical protein
MLDCAHHLQRHGVLDPRQQFQLELADAVIG